MNISVLLDKVRTGTAIETDFAEAWPKAMHGEHDYAWRAYVGDLNAANALHDAALHERVICEHKYSARYGSLVRLWDMGTLLADGESDKPARAWLTAILSVLIAGT
jgi:hypothetical protein